MNRLLKNNTFVFCSFKYCVMRNALDILIHKQRESDMKGLKLNYALIVREAARRTFNLTSLAVGDNCISALSPRGGERHDVAYFMMKIIFPVTSHFEFNRREGN